MTKQIVNDLIEKSKQENLELDWILNDLFENEELKERYINVIRRSTIIWEIANKVLKKIWSKESCKIMAIWDIKLFNKNEKKWLKIVKKSLNSIKPEKLIWYDLKSQWSLKLRESLYNYTNRYYELSNFDKQIIIDNIVPTYWATDWFVWVIDSIKTLNKDKKINFIYHEASFLANIEIANSFLWKENLVKVDKYKKDSFFFEADQLEELIQKRKIKKTFVNIYYITPVWNPTGSMVDIQKLNDFMAKALEITPNCVFVFDSVYIWLLKMNKSKWLFENIFNDTKIINKIIFTESLSKTLWMTGNRIWWIWTLNNEFASEIKKNITLKKAWFSKILNEFSINLLSDTNKLYKFEQWVFDFWNLQRMSFTNYIKENYSKYFNFSASSQIVDREWIYVFLKLRDNYNFNEVFVQTWIIWVWIELSDWKYIRYAIANVDYFS